MERYNGIEHRRTEAYLMQGADSNPHLTATPPLEEIDVMDGEMAPEFIVDQGTYYPAAANYYGYYCTGFESPGEWDDQNRFFGVDGPDLHYPGLQTESLPYVYYTPSYGYPQSPYNPYNPYIPGAIVGVDGPFIGAQQYFSGPAYQHPVSSAYFPVIVQPRPDILPNSSLDAPWLNLGTSSANRPENVGPKRIPPASTVSTMPSSRTALVDGRTDAPQPVSHHTHSSSKAAEATQLNAVSSKQPLLHGALSSSSVPYSTSSHVTLDKNGNGSVQVADPFSFGRVSSLHNQLKVTLPAQNSLADFGPNARGWAAVEKLRSGLQFGAMLNNRNAGPDVLGEQNRGPRTNRVKSPWTSSISVKAYTTKAGSSNAQGNIIIHCDQYNREDFPISYPCAKFFVIKSYSEDDVHKSIKYNVWSSTPNGNKRLDNACEDARRVSGGKPGLCPIFLFFSVNASGQFCGVAEMIGCVDFDKDMDFWQQDKWSGSFRIKWHIIKDVPNTNFRHIILENNENKPVTNSRDTQEIGYVQGMEMLKIFKDYALKTSILDDFTYYEDRQKIMQDEKSRLLKNYDASFFLPTPFIPSSKLNAAVGESLKADEKLSIPSSKAVGEPLKADEKPSFVSSSKPKTVVGEPPKADEKPTEHDDADKPGIAVPSKQQVVLKLEAIVSSSSKRDAKDGVEDVNDATVMKMGSLSIEPKHLKEGNEERLGVVTGVGAPVGVVTVGSMPIKVNGFGESSGVLTVGTISIDPKTVKLKRPDNLMKSSTHPS